MSPTGWEPSLGWWCPRHHQERRALDGPVYRRRRTPAADTAARSVPRRIVVAAELSRRARQRFAMVDWHRAHGSNVSLTARHFGYSRPTVYQALGYLTPAEFLAGLGLAV